MDSLTVLVVEDDVDVNRAIVMRLAGAGYRVFSAVDCIGGMQLAVRERPDVAILDVSIPGGGGLELARRIQTTHATMGMPFVFLTASSDLELPQIARELGASALVQKPFGAEELLSAVANALDSAPTNVYARSDQFSRLRTP